MSRSRFEKRPEHDEISASLQTRVIWSRTDDIHHPFSAQVDGQVWVIRLAEFPEEPLYTLIVDDSVIGSFSAWPEGWQRPARSS